MRRHTPHRALCPITEKAALYRWPGLQHLGRVSGLLTLVLAHTFPASASDFQTAKSGEAKAQQERPRIQMSVGERHYKIRLADTEAARAFSSLIPLTLEMADLNSNEKYVDLAVSLPQGCELSRNDRGRGRHAVWIEGPSSLLQDLQYAVLLHTYWKY